MRMAGASTVLNYKLYCLPNNNVNISLQARSLAIMLTYNLSLIRRLYNLGKNMYTPITS